MKGIFLASVALFPLTTLAGEGDEDKLYQVGISAHHNFRADVDSTTQVKKDWEAGFTLGVQPFHHVGFEAEYFNSYGGETSQSLDGETTVVNTGSDNLKGRLLKVVANYPVHHKVEVFAKTGYGVLDYSENSSSTGSKSHNSDTTWNVIPVALGVEIFPERNLSVEFAYDKYISSRSAQAMTADLKYHF